MTGQHPDAHPYAGEPDPWHPATPSRGGVTHPAWSLGVLTGLLARSLPVCRPPGDVLRDGERSEAPGRRTCMRTSSYAAVEVLLGALVLAGCAGTSGVTSNTGTSATKSPVLTRPGGDPTDPPIPRGRSRPITATGLVTVSDIEKPCPVMIIAGQTYQLVGDEVGALRDGQRVTVSGYADDTIATTCQVGVSFVVTRISALGQP